MLNKNMFRYWATLGNVGFLPAPGTCASLVMMPVVLLIYYLKVQPHTYAAIIFVFTLLSYFIIKKALPTFAQTDPAPIVLDECIGMLIAFYGLPISWLYYIIGFVLFRLLDISKIFGIAQLEKIHGAWGVILDDVLAALITNAMLRFLVPYICY